MVLFETMHRLVARTRAFAATTVSPSMPVERAAPRWWSGLLAWFATYRAPLVLFALTRLMFLVITYAGVALLAPGHSNQRLAGESLPDMLLRWDAWDARWFTGLAASGYAGYQPGTSSAFFPVLPLLAHVLGAPFAAYTSTTAYFVAGMIVSNLAFLGALFVLYRLALDLADGETAHRAILYLAVFPTALFAFTAYSESLFLLFCLGSYLCMRREQWVWAAVLAGCATATRFFGLALAVPFVIELARRYRFDWRAWLRHGWSLLFIPLSIGLFSFYLWRTIGDPFGYWHAEIHWHRHFMEPLQTLWIVVTTVWQLPFGSTHQFNELFDLAVVVFDLGIFIYALTPRGRKQLGLPVSLVALGIVLLLIPLSDPFVGYVPDFIASTARFAFAIFPAFIVLARLLCERPTWHEAVLVVSTGFLILYSLGFVLGDYVV